jgi:hypothetical protein
LGTRCLGFESRWGRPPTYPPEIRATPPPGIRLDWIPRWLLAVAQLHGCRGVSTCLDTLDGQDSSLGKFSIERFIEEFPKLVSKVSEVSTNGLICERAWRT